jgi:peptidyl-prolyl cis-trans isomerase D
MAISWMQRHKKWLVITIWISTIAFVGAGFVGWGAYNPSQSGGSVATVGNKDVAVEDIQREYNGLFNQYQQMFGAQFNQEMAKQLKLEELAYNNIVQRFLLLNLADEYGITATDKDVAKELVTITSFHKEGKFDETTYRNVLAQNRTTTTDFEEQLRQDIIVKKVTGVFTTPTNAKTLENINKVFFAEDKVSINVIDANKFKVHYSAGDLKKFYDENKENYKSKTQYAINIEKVAIRDDAKKSKKTALKKYLELKKKKATFNATEMIDESTTYIAAEDLEKIFKSKKGEVLKPIKTKDNYIVVQLKEKVEPQVLDFKIVKNQIKEDYIAKMKSTKVNAKKDALIKNFSGKDIGYINKETLPKIAGLDEVETSSLVQSIFASDSVINFVELNNKIVVYKIEDTKLATYDASKDQLLVQSINQVKDNEVLTSLINVLQTKYEVKNYMQVK